MFSLLGSVYGNAWSKPMTDKTALKINLDAAQKAVDHWIRLSACMTPEQVHSEGYHCDSCAFCNLYYNCVGCDCVGCPIYARTGEDGCYGTPYHQANISLEEFCDNYDDPDYEWTDEDQANVEAQVRFLESIRDELAEAYETV